MRYILILLVCFSTSVFSQMKIQEPDFVTVKHIFNLEIGMTIEEVKSSLSPAKMHRFYGMTKDGGQVLEYKYKHKTRKLKGEVIGKYNQFKKGKIHYQEEASLFLFINKRGELERYFTEAGNDKSNYILKLEETMEKVLRGNINSEDCDIVLPE